MKYGETFYGRHMTLNTCWIEVNKHNNKSRVTVLQSYICQRKRNTKVGCTLTLVVLNKLRCHAHFTFSANQFTGSRLLIQIQVLNGTDLNLHCFQRQCYPGSAELGLTLSHLGKNFSRRHIEIHVRGPRSFLLIPRKRDSTFYANCLHERLDPVFLEKEEISSVRGLLK